ncbi:MAG: hypothetical protein DBY28_00140 [Subdoligranulum sp.]|nr:MAG: hypothetical protein DBY28_00140 [Subdoligranulum sp.]
MTKFGTLLKVNLRQQFRARKNTSKKTMPVWGIYIVLGVVLLPLLAMLFSTFVSAGEFLSEPQYAPYLNAAVTFAITAIELVNVFFGLKSMLGTVYMSNDSDMLLALPLKTVTIFLSKLAVCYIVEFFSTLVMLAATLLPLGIGLSAGAGYFAALIFGAFLIPLISLLAVAILSVPLLLVSNLFRNKGAVGTIIYVLLFGALMALYMWFVVSLGWGTGDFNGADVGAMLDGILESVSSAAAYLYPNVWLSGAFTAATFGGWIGNFALFLLSALVLLGLTVLLSGKIFLWNMRKSQENAGKGGKKTTYKFAGGNKISSLLAADFKNMLRTSSLGFYCLTQVVVIPVCVVIYCLALKDVGGEGEMQNLLSMVSRVMLVIMGPMTCVTAASSVSREGENFYLIKTLPVKPSQYALSKLIISLIFNGAAFALSVVFECIFVKIGIVVGLLDFLTVFCASAGVSAALVLIDMKNPRLKWTTVQQGLKNNPSSLWGMLVGFVAGGVLTVVVVLSALDGWTFVGQLVNLLLGAGMAAGGVAILLNNCEKYFYAVE